MLSPDDNAYWGAPDKEDPTPTSSEGGIRPLHGRTRPRPGKVVAKHSSGENRRIRGGASLVEQQKALCREIKALGQRRDWRDALRVLQ